MTIRRYIWESMERNVAYTRFAVIPAAWFGFIGSPLYWVIWTYVFPQQHDSIFLRATSTLACVPGLFVNNLPSGMTKAFPLYWHFAIIYVLPFSFTYLLLANDFSIVWLLCHLGMIVLVTELVTDILWFGITIFTGTLLAILAFLALNAFPTQPNLPLEYLPILIFALGFSSMVLYTTRQRLIQSQEQRAQSLKALSGTIAHEVRKPVSQAKQALSMIQAGLAEIERLRLAGREDEYLRRLHALYRVASTGYQGMDRGDMLINIILRNIREEKIDPGQFEPLSVAEVVDKALDSYAFVGDQRKRVHLDLAQDFQVHADENLLIYVLFNLLQNAFYHLGERPDAAVWIRLRRGAARNRLVFSDNGPGIAPDKIQDIFASFETYGKKEGTGLGLPFCKRVMTAAGGDIECRSELGKGTDMILAFPPCQSEQPAAL